MFFQWSSRRGWQFCHGTRVPATQAWLLPSCQSFLLLSAILWAALPPTAADVSPRQGTGGVRSSCSPGFHGHGSPRSFSPGFVPETSSDRSLELVGGSHISSRLAPMPNIWRLLITPFIWKPVFPMGTQNNPSEGISRHPGYSGVSCQPKGGRRVLFHGPPGKCRNDKHATVSWEDYGSPALEWRPERGKYLVAICRYGRVSNQLICLRRYLWFAVLLNRTLVVPKLCFHNKYNSWFPPSRWADQLDLGAIDRCASGNASSDDPSLRHILGEEEFLKMRGESCVQIDKILLLTGKYEPAKQFHSLRWLFPNCSTVAEMDKPTQVLSDNAALPLDKLQVLQNIPDAVLSFGSLFSEYVQGYNFYAPYAPFRLAPGCGDLWVPSAQVETVTVHAVTKLGGRGAYAALHWRRGDFGRHYKPGEPGFLDIAEVAGRVVDWLRPLQVSRLYVATDGTLLEIQELEALVRELTKGREVVCFHMRTDALRMEEEVRDVADDVKGAVLAAVEKQICSRAKAFLGTTHSTYTDEIQRIRIASAGAHCSDALLSQVEAPKLGQNE